jgi:hypothetical protein
VIHYLPCPPIQGIDTMTTDIFKTELKLGNILDELNQRAKQYHKGSGMSVEFSQEQALQDFAPYNKDGKYVRAKKVKDDQYFIEKA